MRKLLVLMLVVGPAFAACSAVAVNPVGTWKGKFYGGPAKLPGRLTPASRKALDVYLERLKSMRVLLKIKRNHTFVIDISGTENGKKTKLRTEGKWKLSADKVVTTNLKLNGRRLHAQGQAVNELTLSKDGKTLTRRYDQGPVLGKIVLKRVSNPSP